MNFRHYLTLQLCPLIARLVLAATFIWFGFGKFKSMEYSGEDAGILISLGIGKPVAATDETVDPALPPSSRIELDSPSKRLAFTNAILAAPISYQEGDEETTNDDDITQPSPDDTDAAESTDSTDPTAADEPEAIVYATDKTVKAAKFHTITLMLQRAGHSSPVWMARLAVMTEAVGGILILIGLFTRVWALGLAIAMAYAFYLTTWAALSGFADPTTGNLGTVLKGLTSIGKLNFGDQISAFFQLANFGLGLIVFLGGPGRYSLDHLIFRARSAPTFDADDD